MKENTVPAEREEQTPAQDTREEERTLTPPVDIFETKDGLAVIADLPGVAKGDADVSVDGDVLTIKGKVSAEMPGEPLRHEYELADYFRQFRLSDEVDRDKISAEMKNGVLTLTLPKAEKSKPKRIEVKTS